MTGRGIHAVKFYENSESLCRMAGDFLADGLLDGYPAIVIATLEHREGMAARITERGLDVPTLKAHGDIVLLDAEATLAKFVRDGMPDPLLFARTASSIIEAVSGRHRSVDRRKPPRAYGEMVDVLWRAGQTRSAQQLEILWNNLARYQPFSMLCGYAIDSLYREGDVDAICSHHSHVLSEGGEVTSLN
jgi:MEDS: MEthanogen/methylotroph, DcmR Sensory domain